MKTIVVFFRTCPLEEPSLRHVETDVLIPKMMREKAKERCAEKVEGMYVRRTLCEGILLTFLHIWPPQSQNIPNQLRLSDVLFMQRHKAEMTAFSDTIVQQRINGKKPKKLLQLK